MDLLKLMEPDAPSGKTSPASSPTTTTPSAAFWEHLSAQTMPCFRAPARPQQSPTTSGAGGKTAELLGRPDLAVVWTKAADALVEKPKTDAP